MLEFWNSLTWPQAILIFVLTPWVLLFLFFLFGGEITIQGETKHNKAAKCNYCGKEKPLVITGEVTNLCKECAEELLPLAARGK